MRITANDHITGRAAASCRNHTGLVESHFLRSFLRDGINEIAKKRES